MTLRNILGISPEPHLKVFRSYAHKHRVHIIGRVTERAQIPHGRTLFHNALSLVRTYLARPYRKLKLTVQSDDTTVTAYTNEHGVFEVECPRGEYIYAIVGNQKVRVEVFYPSKHAVFGIISDIDDTILISNVARTIKLLFLLFTKNAHSRKPFPGVAEFYTALSHEGENPLFYISSSAWNLYDLLIEFMDLNAIPKGPLLLKEVGGIRSVLRGIGNHQHKYEKIEKVLSAYPDLPFILLGDSGQQDVRIYSALAMKYPGRIKAIYIRDVSIAAGGRTKVALHTQSGSTELILVQTTEEAATHARSKGYIAEKEVVEVREGITREEGAEQ